MVDNFTRERLAIEVGASFPVRQVLAVLDWPQDSHNGWTKDGVRTILGGAKHCLCGGLRLSDHNINVPQRNLLRRAQEEEHHFLDRPVDPSLKRQSVGARLEPVTA